MGVGVGVGMKITNCSRNSRTRGRRLFEGLAGGVALVTMELTVALLAGLAKRISQYGNRKSHGED